MRPSACAVVVDEDGRVLLGRRADTGKLSLPVGWYSPAELPDLGTFDQLRVDAALDDDAPKWFSVPGRMYNWLPSRT